MDRGYANRDYNMMLRASISSSANHHQECQSDPDGDEDIPDSGYKGLKVLRNIGLYIKGALRDALDDASRNAQRTPYGSIRAAPWFQYRSPPTFATELPV